MWSGSFLRVPAAELLPHYNIIKLKVSRTPRARRCAATGRSPTRGSGKRSPPIDRPAIVQALFKGFAYVVNDSPFAAVFPFHRHQRGAADRWHGQGQACSPRPGSRLSFHPSSCTETSFEIPSTPPDRGRKSSTAIG